MNILIALDSSATAQAALAAALAREWPEGTTFRVLTVLPWKSRVAIGGVQFNADLDRAHCLIDRACNQIEAQNEDSIVVGQIDVGDPASKIVASAKSWPADLIVVGSHDRTPLQRMLMGSVSRSVLQQAKCSVLVARKVALSQSPVKAMKRVLVAVDDTASSRVAADEILNSQWASGTRFHLLTVVRPLHELSNYAPSAVSVMSKMDIRKERLAELQGTLSEMGVEFEERLGRAFVEMTILEGEPSDCIAEAAQSWGADLVALGSHSQPDWSRRLLGSSVSQTVASQAPCSVQVIRSNIAQIKPISSTSGSSTLQKASGF